MVCIKFSSIEHIDFSCKYSFKTDLSSRKFGLTYFIIAGLFMLRATIMWF